jgi:hypothetical protein
MYYDLNVPWTTNAAELKNRLSFLAECTSTYFSAARILISKLVGYNVVAISYILPNPAPSDLVQ